MQLRQRLWALQPQRQVWRAKIAPVKLPQRLLQGGNVVAESGAAADMKAVHGVQAGEHLPLCGFAAGFHLGAQQAIFGVDDLNLLCDRSSPLGCHRH